VLRSERTFEAPIDRVFAAWVSEEVLRRWLHAQPDWETPTAEVDLHVGDRIRVVMRDPSDGSPNGALTGPAAERNRASPPGPGRLSQRTTR
jgi:uncharacterized protein YndB with AHSA1/START domain